MDALLPLQDEPPRAASFIVTVYGDVVEPRGGVLWIGSLIDICGSFGITETLVRTAVSRLVEAGQLIGEREGRRSYYRLTPEAQIAFAHAAEALFNPPQKNDGWLFLARPEPAAETPLLREGFAAFSPTMLIGADRQRGIDLLGLMFRATTAQGSEELPEFAARYWNLSEHADAYITFIGRFQTFAKAIENGGKINKRDSMIARLALVHDYRAVLLRDPRLPRAALPEDWPGGRAAALFATLYCRLSSAADAFAGEKFSDSRGQLASETDTTRRRLAALHVNTSVETKR